MAATWRRVKSVAPSESCLDLGQRPALRLEALDSDELEQMPRPVERRATPHGAGPVDEADGRVPADDPAVGHLGDPPVGCANVADRERSATRPASSSSVQSPATPAIMTLSS